MLVAIKNYRFVSIFLTVILVLSGMTVLELTYSPPAHASEATCASSGSCQDISTSVALQNAGSGGGAGNLSGGNLGGGGGAPVAGGGGGAAPAPVIPQTCDVENPGWCASNYMIRATFQAMGPRWVGTPLPDCGVKTISGIKVYPVGFTRVERNDLVRIVSSQDAGSPPTTVYTGWYTLSQVCNYPPDPTNVSTNVKCILSYNANITRLSNSFAGAGGVAGGSSSRTIASLASLENAPSGCKSSITANFGINIGRSQRDYGWYKATSNVTWATCTFGSITFNGATTRSGACKNSGAKAGSIGKLTVYCGPAIHDWVQLDWTGKDCYKTGPSCSVPNTSKFNGYSGTVQALRDGNDNTMSWANPKFTAGITGATNWKAKTDVKSGSTPYNTSVGVNDKSKQLFRSGQNFGSWVTIGGQLAPLQNQKLAFYTSGSTGSPFKMTRNYLYDANFRTVATTITGFNVTTGALSTGSSSATVFLKNNPCGPQSSPAINAVRAIGDVIPQ